MDFSRNSTQPTPAAPRPGGAFGAEGSTPSTSSKGSSKHSKVSGVGRWYRPGVFAMLIVIALLMAAVVGFLITSNQNGEANYVDNSKLQAVFLTNDQVYFGKITQLNGKYLVLSNIYYLQTSGTNSAASTTTASNVSLVKLGCELHRPYDQMVVNRNEVQFWENLQTSGQVATAVKQFQKQNPNGQKCSTTTTNSTNVQGGSASTSTNSTTNSTTNSNSNSSNSTNQ